MRWTEDNLMDAVDYTVPDYVQDYDAGMSLEELAKKYGCTVNKMVKRLRDEGISPHTEPPYLAWNEWDRITAKFREKVEWQKKERK